MNAETPGNALEHWPSGGCSMSPFLSQVPIGWISAESISLQKSLVLSLPSRRSRRRIPIMPITVAMQTELELRGSRASSFIPALNSFEGGTLDCRGTHGRHQKQEMFSHRSTQDRQKTGKWLNNVKNADKTATCLKQVGDAAMEDVSLR